MQFVNRRYSFAYFNKKGRINRPKQNLTHYSIRVVFQISFIKTINKNLKNYDFESEQILFEDFFFYENIHKKNKWDLILVVDESGSMMDSVLYSSIMASIFATLPVFRTRLVIFDTEVVDLTSELHNIIEVMFKIRLGGGTDIAKALAYSSTLITNFLVTSPFDPYQPFPFANSLALYSDEK